jgi:hypothetical protein
MHLDYPLAKAASTGADIVGLAVLGSIAGNVKTFLSLTPNNWSVIRPVEVVEAL